MGYTNFITNDRTWDTAFKVLGDKINPKFCLPKDFREPQPEIKWWYAITKMIQ